jgi:hypothetical protein
LGDLTRNVAIVLLAGAMMIAWLVHQADTEGVGVPPEYAPLAGDLEYLREVLAVPGLSVAVVRDCEIAWEQGFGFADLETQSRPTSTPRTVSPLLPSPWRQLS